MLRNRLQQGIKNLPGVRINGDLENRLDGHLHISIDDASAQTLLMKLDMAGIAASAGSACASGSLARSHVIEAMGFYAQQCVTPAFGSETVKKLKGEE